MTMKKIDEKQNKIIVDLYVKMYYYQIYQTGSIRRNTQKNFSIKEKFTFNRYIERVRYNASNPNR